ncbi:hypothetical protein NM208_g8197 [Fusarium decemcellulare]|uniref:Uncharacterized protein n=1 Tax=Fusarium decemcellulare TaxID=57161 RepID=A0ACC1S6D2_9HYPO|nr:hypothetical protein NM208_g8197 [Fusarium decemcellulare]
MEAVPWQSDDMLVQTQQMAMHDQNLSEVAPCPQAMDLSFGILDNTAYPVGTLEDVALSGTARRISRSEWDRHKQAIIANYPLMTLPELKKYMAETYRFTASTQQWKKKLGEWRLTKNLPRPVARFVGKRGQSRLHEKGKKTQFFLGGQPVPIDKVKRHMQSYQGPSKSLTGTTPDGVSYETYKSPALIPLQLRAPTQTPTTQAAPSRNSVPVDPPLTSSPHFNPGMGLDQVQMAFWNGRDLDDLLGAARHACQLAENGDYMSAKPIFMECLDGIEVLLTPVHATFVGVLQQYVSYAVSHKDFDEATARVHKSYNDHKERLGSHDRKVWQCLARLGLLYYSRNMTSQAFHMLRNARQGLLVATSGDPEEAYNCVHDIVKAIVSIFIKQDDFDEAERELLSLIAQAEALGEAYVDDALRHKHDLVHLYHDNWSRSERTYGHTPPNRTRVEKLLLEIIQFNSISLEMSHMQTCCWDKLRDFYGKTGQRTKLENLLPKLEDLFGRTAFLGSRLRTELRYKENMVSSFLSLGQYEKAEWWLLRMRDEIEQQTFERISINMQLAQLYFQLGKSDDAVSMLKEAQGIGKEILPEEHIFHSVVTQSIGERRVSDGCCPTCRVNAPGMAKGRKPEIADFIASEAEIDYPAQFEQPGGNDEEESAQDEQDHGEESQLIESPSAAEEILTLASIVNTFEYEA